MNQDQFLLDSGFWGWLYKLLYPVEWLMTQIMAGFHRFMVMLGMNEIGFSWVMSIVFLVIVVQACVFPLFYKSMKGMRKMQAQMAVLQPKMQRIQNKYKGKNDPASKEALQREMMKLYQDNDANPMGGCTSMLPMFVQGPVFMCMFYTLSAIPYIARGKFRNGSGLGAFDIATAKQFTSTNVFGVNVAENFTTADIHGKIIIGKVNVDENSDLPSQYGIRNIPDREKALSEAYRVLRPGGRFVILEFSTPSNPVWRVLYHAYLNVMIPFIGGLLTHDRPGFVYLKNSINAFPDQEGLASLLRAAGFDRVTYENCTGGITAIHQAIK